MPTKDLLVLLGVFVAVIFAVLIFFFPSEEKRRKKKKKKTQEEELSKGEKKWQETAFALRDRIQGFKKEIERKNQQEKKLLLNLKEEKDKNVRIEDKLKREKKWFSEQESNLDRRTKEMRQIKMDLVRAQTESEKEYSLRLAAEREKKDFKKDFDRLNKEKKEYILKTTHLDFTIRTLKEEIDDLKKANHDLAREAAKKNEEGSQWIAKSEFEKIEKAFKEKEKEVEKLKKDWRR
ncbi:MAG: hypothetical protein P9M07_05355 [Candidatus Aceula meridiana]|nr:hypothetical protein [Candidatus Aceula meridiana]